MSIKIYLNGMKFIVKFELRILFILIEGYPKVSMVNFRSVC